MSNKKENFFCHKNPKREKEENKYSLSEEELMKIRQQSDYDKYNKATPDNNPFFENRNNPLSSKGN